MADYTLRVRRYQPESGNGPYWEDFDVELEESLSVLDGILQAKDRDDGSLSVRCSCRAAICGSCGVKVNGRSTLACKTKIQDAHEEANREAAIAAGSSPDLRPARPANYPGPPGPEAEEVPGIDAEDAPRPILVEPMANMAVIKDLVTDMDQGHWSKVRRVTPWLLPAGDPPEREYVVDPEAMIDITQSMA